MFANGSGGRGNVWCSVGDGETGVRHVSWEVIQAAHGMSNIQLHVMLVDGGATTRP